VIVSKWFKGAELAFAMALNLSFCKLAGVMTAWLSPHLEAQYGLIIASVIVSTLCVICYILGLLLIYEEYKYEGYHDSLENSQMVLYDESIDNRSLPSTIKKKTFTVYDTSLNMSFTPRSTVSTGSGSQTQSYNSIATTPHRSVERLEYKHYREHLSHPKEGYMHTYISDSPNALSSLNRYSVKEREGFTAITGRAGHGEQTPLLPLPAAKNSNSPDTPLIFSPEDFSGVDITTTPRILEVEFDDTLDESTIITNLKETMSELKEVPKLAWLMCFLTFLMYGTFIPFSNIANSVLLELFYKGKEVDMKQFEVSAARFLFFFCVYIFFFWFHHYSLFFLHFI
jgi:hypothetical protein